jgi:hypothetical protein
MREIRTSGSVGGQGGNSPVHPTTSSASGFSVQNHARPSDSDRRAHSDWNGPRNQLPPHMTSPTGERLGSTSSSNEWSRLSFPARNAC